MSISERAEQMRAAGIDVLSFSAGEPDLPTAPAACAQAIEAIRAGKTRYTPVAGIKELRAAIGDKLARDNGLEYASNEILVSPGAKGALFHALAALVDDQVDVLIPTPYWVTYPEAVRLLDGRPVLVPGDPRRDFKVTREHLERARTANSRVLILNTPNNPTGAVYEPDELQEIADFAERHDIAIVSDEIYERMVFAGAQHVSIAALSPSVKARTIVVNGVSKSYCMTGWRIGFAAGPAPIIAAMTRIQSHSVSNAASISQWAALAALQHGETAVSEMVHTFEQRRDRVVRAFRAIPDVRLGEPKGAFYVFPDVSAYVGLSHAGARVADATALCRLLLEQARVALVPGEAFGQPGFLRFSYAAALPTIEEGLRRITEFLVKLRSQPR
ncbi:MAG: pyridoxal phosphate-dependent aminotransferase [Planctomycetota bacterium]